MVSSVRSYKFNAQAPNPFRKKCWNRFRISALRALLSFRRESVRRADFFAIGAVTRCRRWSTANYLRGYGWREGEANHQVLRPLE
jgi:hypothetical protein